MSFKSTPNEVRRARRRIETDGRTTRDNGVLNNANVFRGFDNGRGLPDRV